MTREGSSRCGSLARRMPVALLLCAALYCALFASGCSSTGRMLRISPFIGEGSRERVNLWPLAYHDRGATSVLWPLFDIDKKGFALRPLIAKEGSELTFLFPISAYDSVKGTGWFALFYKFENNAGLFPLANFGRLNWVIPFWWLEDASGDVESGGLFPLAHFGQRSYVLLAYWNMNDSGKLESGGLFPLAHFGDFNWAIPFWWNEDGSSYGLFPLFGVGKYNHVGPFWWSSRALGAYSAGLAPLIWWDSEGEDVGFVPLYWHHVTDDSASRWALLGLAHSEHSPDFDQSWLFPLYYSKETPDRADRLLFPFFYSRTRGDDKHVFTLLGDRSVDANGTGFNLYPFWWSSTTEERATRMLLPLFYYERDGDSRSLLSPLGGYGWTASGDSRYVNVLGPLYHHSESIDGSEERTAFLWPLFERHRTPKETTTRALPLFTHTENAEGDETWYGLGLGHGVETQNGEGSRLWPLYSYFDTPREPDLLYSLTLYAASDQDGVSRRRLFPLFWSKTSAKESEQYYLLGLGHSLEAEGERTWRFWPLVSQSSGTSNPGPLYDLSLFGHAKWAGGESTHLLGPLLYRNTSATTEDSQTSQTRLLTFFLRQREKETGFHVPESSELSRENRVELRSSGFFFDAVVDRDETFHVWKEGAVTREEVRALRPFSGRRSTKPAQMDASGRLAATEESAREVLERRGYAPESDDEEALRRAVVAFTEANTERVERSTSRFPALYSFRESGDSRAWSGPLWLVNSRRDAHSSEFFIPLIYHHERTETSTEWSGPLWLVNSRRDEEGSKFNLLYYGYRSETEGTRTTRDIFPFITWDSDEDETEVSFLWRLFHYHRKGDESGGHILFIPWGES